MRAEAENQQPSGYVICSICNLQRKDLSRHIVSKHNMSVATYKELYPKALVRLPYLTSRISKMAKDNAVKANRARVKLIKEGKISPGGSNFPNKPEQIIVGLNISSLEYVGDRSFWLQWKNESFHNPDFVVRPFRFYKKVVELFGDRWHGKEITGMSKEEHQQLYIDSYKAIGVQCLIIWGSELTFDPLKVKERIINFITEGSESRHETSEKDEGVLRSTVRTVEASRNVSTPLSQRSVAFIQCAICGAKLKQITWTHLKTKHNINIKQYIKMYPDSPLTHPDNNKVMIENHRKSVKRRYNVENVSQVKEIRQKQKDTMLERYGTLSLGGRKRK